MKAAGIHGARACPKGLRHGFGVQAALCGVNGEQIRRWLGHASIKTTGIYTSVVGDEEREMVARMWG